jgi:DNA-binding transcriptional regulator YhcF (GntR family)
MGKSQYAAIVDTLVDDLAGCRPGACVASEHEIAARFAVSRAVAGAALRELESRLLVRRVRGSGTFVNGRIDYIISAGRTPSFSQTVRAAGAEPRSAVRSITAEPLPDDLAARLERAPGSTAHRIVRQNWINDMPAGWVIEWIPDDVFPDGADVAVRAVEWAVSRLGFGSGGSWGAVDGCDRGSSGRLAPEGGEVRRLCPGLLVLRADCFHDRGSSGAYIATFDPQ